MNEEHDRKRAPQEELQDIDFEPEEELGDIGAAKAKLKKLKDELEKAKKERQEYLDGWQRSKADAINVRQETMRQAERLSSRAFDALVEDLIPVLDSFDMATGSPTWENVVPEWREGMDQVRNQLLNALSQHGIERYGKSGESVDHRLHEVVQESGEFPGEVGTIARILRFGYRKGDRVIRPAQVIVKK